jgi:hypothetical protein
MASGDQYRVSCPVALELSPRAVMREAINLDHKARFHEHVDPADPSECDLLLNREAQCRQPLADDRFDSRVAAWAGKAGADSSP